MSSSHLMHTYSPNPVAFARGEGAWLWDTNGKKYLDALSGIAVNGLGHGHPEFTKAIADKRIIHKNKAARHKSRLHQQVKALAGRT